LLYYERASSTLSRASGEEALHSATLARAQWLLGSAYLEKSDAVKGTESLDLGLKTAQKL
jgi:hypothetical protein